VFNITERRTFDRLIIEGMQRLRKDLETLGAVQKRRMMTPLATNPVKPKCCSGQHTVEDKNPPVCKYVFLNAPIHCLQFLRSVSRI
jgi:hypothetical protein